MLLVLSTGCAVSKPVHYYSLTSSKAHASQGRPDGPTILVGSLATSESLQDVRIRYRAGANEEGAYELHHWTERPSVMVREALMQALRASGRYQRVMESSSLATGDYLIRGRIHDFDEVDSDAVQTRISLQLDIIDKKTNRTIWDHLFERDEPSSGQSIRDVVASMDRNLAQLTRQAAAEIERVLTGPR
jgi:ABC-type uncharacterized transport system auxiliary subunit